ncbi:formate dehydrogenase accessory sulfurtransferase FdhD [Chelativorans sp. AA-79]|uniref:formate dehydrogenase accessory sulfurtransferase FdhD n=1 Tax=Chelativorans sp. AA-79 TaxID=3028735 RepID=UPI0023F96808|nr:formate dehydrogenase accessory sulfurtransferase FdhD [Chelativorans sp. AA-79]WEX09483.1 formate dehydrogenase accessory sulfurtransferase FdhD [Chelativorans sp. AA-79]
MTSPLSKVLRTAQRADGTRLAARVLPKEAAVALSYGGTTHAVMMATPDDLEDFALGFSLTEGIISSPDEIDSIAVQDLGTGFDVQIRLKDTANKRFEARRRRLAGPVGCGLCGIESIEEAMRDVPSVTDNPLRLTAQDVVQSVQRLSEQQTLHRQTGAVHAAGFYVASKGIVATREDVGRHNALDKLAGALAKTGIQGTSGAVIITSRVSVEMVQKAAAIGAPVVIAVSAPTALAVTTAEQCGQTVVALVRGNEFDVFTHPERIETGAARHVA